MFVSEQLFLVDRFNRVNIQEWNSVNLNIFLYFYAVIENPDHIILLWFSIPNKKC